MFYKYFSELGVKIDVKKPTPTVPLTMATAIVIRLFNVEVHINGIFVTALHAY